MKVSELARDAITTKVFWKDEEISLVFKPSVLTPERGDRFDAEYKELGQKGHALASYVADVLESWGVVDDDGKPVAPTVAFLMRVDQQLLWDIVEAVATANRPLVRKNGSPSNATSSPAEK
jgi:hypothetical protein